MDVMCYDAIKGGAMKTDGYLRWHLWLVVGFLIVATLACTLPWSRREAGPSVAIDSPSSGTTVQVGQEVTIQSTSTDARGVTKVELWVDEALVHTDSSPVARGQTPFSVLQSWTPLSPGEYTIVVKAYNAAGQVGESEAVTLSAVEAVGEASPTPSLEATETSTPVVASPTPTSTPMATPTFTPTGATPTPTNTATPTSTPTATPPAGPCLPTPVAIVSVGVHPKGVAAGANRVYVGLHDAPQVKVIDRASNTVVATWGTGATVGPRYANGVVLSHRRLYVANRGQGSVSSINIDNPADKKILTVGSLPFGVAAGTDYVFVANYGSDNVTIIDSRSLTVAGTAPVPGDPTMIAALGNNAYVASWSGGVYRVGSDGSVAQVVSSDQGHFFGVAANPVTARVYISNQSDNSVVVLDANTNTIVATISMPAIPHALAVNSGNNRIYIVAAAMNKLYVLDGDTNQLIGNVSVGQQDATEGGQGIAIQSDRIYVSNYAAGTLTVLDDSACQ